MSNSQTRDFLDLSKQIKDAGLMDRRTGSYMIRSAVLGLAFIIAVTLLLTLGNSLWQLGVAALFAVLFTQVAFLCHDSAHQQVFASSRSNIQFSRIAGNLVVGMSYQWWVRKHSKHHGSPNTIGRDGDIRTGVLVFNPEDSAGRSGLLGWITPRQGWLFFPLLTLYGPLLHFNAVKTLVQQKNHKHRKVDGTLLVIRLISFPLLVLLVLGPGLGAGFLAIQLMVFGLYMGSSFAPNHKGMPLIPQGTEIDFLHRQVLTSRNIRGGQWLDWAMGGLNYQIEHHIFPRMPSANLPRVQPLVKQFCNERGISYTETGLFEAYGIVIRYLNRVGLGYSDPMECPVVAQFRPV